MSCFMVIIQLFKDEIHEMPMDVEASLVDAVPQIILHFSKLI
jgi:hypothetical protein